MYISGGMQSIGSPDPNPTQQKHKRKLMTEKKNCYNIICFFFYQQIDVMSELIFHTHPYTKRKAEEYDRDGRKREREVQVSKQN